MHIFFYCFALHLLFSSGILFKQNQKHYAPEMVLIEGGSFIIGDIFEGENRGMLRDVKANDLGFRCAK